MPKKKPTIFLIPPKPVKDVTSSPKSEQVNNNYITNINHYHYSKTKSMDVATIAKTASSLLNPILKKSKSIKQITSEIIEAADTSLLELWEKIKPIFIEEFEEEDKNLSKDVKSEAIVAREIRKSIEGDETTQTYLEERINAITIARKNKDITIIGGKGHTVNTGDIRDNKGDIIIGGRKNDRI